MIELLLFIAGVALLGALAVGVLKLLLGLIVLPLKFGFWIMKGAIGLFLVIPAVILGVVALSALLPFALAIIVVPVLCLIACAAAVLDLIF